MNILEIVLCSSFHGQLADTVQHLVSTFADGENAPRFGTCNFTLPSAGRQFIETDCPLDRQATEAIQRDKAVSKKAADGLPEYLVPNISYQSNRSSDALRLMDSAH